MGGSVRSIGAARRRRRVKVKRRGSIVVASSNGLAEPIDEETHLQDRARRARVARRHRHERLQRRLLLFGTHPDRGGAPIRARRTTVHLRSGARDFLRAPTRPRDHRTKFVVVDFRVSRATARRRAKGRFANGLRGGHRIPDRAFSTALGLLGVFERSIVHFARPRRREHRPSGVPGATNMGDEGAPRRHAFFVRGADPSTGIPHPVPPLHISEWTVVGKGSRRKMTAKGTPDRPRPPSRPRLRRLRSYPDAESAPGFPGPNPTPPRSLRGAAGQGGGLRRSRRGPSRRHGGKDRVADRTRGERTPRRAIHRLSPRAHVRGWDGVLIIRRQSLGG